MAKYNRKPKPKVNGSVYIVSILVQGEMFFKIGTSNRSARTRLLEMAGELLDKIGYIPVMRIVKEELTRDNYKVEADVLLETLKYRPSSACILWDKFSGFTETRQMSKDELITIYKTCLAKDYPVVKQQLIGM